MASLDPLADETEPHQTRKDASISYATTALVASEGRTRAQELLLLGPDTQVRDIVSFAIFRMIAYFIPNCFNLTQPLNEERGQSRTTVMLIESLIRSVRPC